ncbi:hypoxia inducible factor 1 subunit alpha, like 2 isoform X1 [Clarias gariepinus]|uniref:hypoxia inducible factor 1 subunit alpha, like 2 isoform X1 n=2 Tax=Clarias gariepinus TaxID=13013 RepID=UPI00234CB38B|nr:hypoxia inducible factor 1 subunit alpha, like 2 isoform X1 [Clarias gariepinus]XP_053334321.1 hypoxia inducible factor 1 subunit alpha, like 2 isoform X1 [Clarias gariepinus]XP_053334322.1 hypoxia inducible factor 1 subunit alpha, like 2 isoform X1 [Clarias gariepinus]
MLLLRMCLECRKARSRVAAQSRREKESQLFKELAALLPLTPYEADQLDKASVIRVTISHLHLRALLDIPDSTAVGAAIHPVSASHGELTESMEKWFLDTLEGFLLLMSLCGKIIFITKDVVSHIGIKQMDLIGRSLFDFIHPSDHKDIKDILTRIIGSEDQQKCEVFFRIKGAVKNMLTPWQVIHCTGNKKSSSIPGSSYLLLLCRSLPGQEVIEMKAHLNFKTFLSIHEPDMKFTYCHSGVLELTGFSDIELYGQSVYQYYHPSDCQHILKAHLCLLSKGQVYTGKYRLLQKHGGYVWVETDATVVYNAHTGKPEKIVCINYILSGVELPDVVLSLEQTDCLLNALPAPYTTITQNETNPATSTTTDKDTSFVYSSCERDGLINRCTEILHWGALCGSHSDDMADLDLDLLAPYIPTHEEDFHLAPILDEVASDSGPHRHMPSVSETWLNLDQKRMADSDAVCFHRLNWNKNPMLFSLSHWTMNKNQQLIKTFSENWDGRTVWNCSQSYTEPVHLAHKYAELSWCPPGSSLQHSDQNAEENMPTASVNLPVLSRWECEVNAPLGPTSRLLQGTELTNVLDQVASGVCWY